MANLQGTVTSEENGTPLAGVLLALTPGDRSEITDAEGHFAFLDLPVGISYRLTASSEDYGDFSTTIDLTEAAGPRIVDLHLPVVSRMPPPIGELRVWTGVIQGFGLVEPTITFRLQLENRGADTLRSLSIVDSLRAATSSYQLKPDDFSINREIFPNAKIEIGEGGRSFVVTIDELTPTTSLLELLRFTVPTPSEPSVYCNLLWGTAIGDGVLMRHEDSSCLAAMI